jgi:hypothetical protein
MSARRASLAAGVVFAAAVAAAFHPLFTRSVSILYGDTLVHSAPLHYELARFLREGWRFWNPEVSFGFPLYAEATSGWFHPWKLALFSLLPWLTAHDLVYVSSFALTGLACFATARGLGAGAALSLVGALAVTFSPAVLANFYNAAYAHALAWSAVCLLAFERWYANPTRRRVAWLAAAVALLVLAGYPPTAFATLFFLGLALAARIALERRRAGVLVLGFVAAVILGTGLSAFQVLPLLELAAHSVRHAGTAPLQVFPWQNFAVGLVFENDPALYDPNHFQFFLAPLGTPLALVAIAWLPIALRSRVARSYCVATAICVAAAVGPGSPVHALLQLALPGFDHLRMITPFVMVAVAPVGVLLTLALEQAVHGRPTRREALAGAGLAALFGLWLLSSHPAHAATGYYRAVALGILALAGGGIAALRATGRASWAPALLAVLMLGEVTALRSSYLSFLPDSLLDAGGDLAAFLAARRAEDPDARILVYPTKPYLDAKAVLHFQHWKSPGYESAARLLVEEQVPYLNLIDATHCVQAPDSLPLAGIPALRRAIEAEVRGEAALPRGERRMDRWDVRWIVVTGTPALDAGLRVVWQDAKQSRAVLENPDARPLAQWHAAAGPVQPPAEHAALRRLLEALPWVGSESVGAWEIDAPAAGRAFIAIPRYPGFTASVDGTRAPIVAADDPIAMDVPVPAGHHRIELRVTPYSFHLGLLLAAASLALAAWLARPSR